MKIFKVMIGETSADLGYEAKYFSKEADARSFQNKYKKEYSTSYETIEVYSNTVEDIVKLLNELDPGVPFNG